MLSRKRRVVPPCPPPLPLACVVQEQFDLLERCSRRFKDEERYKNDLRYLKVWMAYVSCLGAAWHRWSGGNGGWEGGDGRREGGSRAYVACLGFDSGSRVPGWMMTECREVPALDRPSSERRGSSRSIPWQDSCGDIYPSLAIMPADAEPRVCIFRCRDYLDGDVMSIPRIFQISLDFFASLWTIWTFFFQLFWTFWTF